MSQPDGTFSDVTSTIIDERYLTERDDKEVLQYGSRSLTIEDFDGDGWKDIYLENNLAETMRFYLTMKENLLVKKKVVQKTISLNMQDMVLIIERVIQWILIKMVIKILL